MKKLYMFLLILGGLIVVLALVGGLFLNQKKFGRMPSGERLERIKKSPNFRNGEFQNLEFTQTMTSEKNQLNTMWNFLFNKQKNLRPDTAMTVIKTDLHKLNPAENLLVWFGHSSYLLQLDGKRFLVDPVFCEASPVSFVNKPFKGTDVYKPEDMPDIDYLVITHDHWDHLDYKTVTALKNRTRYVVCGLGVGEHLEYWGFSKAQLIELDWNEHASVDSGFTIHCLPARHFSGRGLHRNSTLWASYMLQTPQQTIYVGGDSGYGIHLAEIGKKFPEIDLAILENGQYNADWQYIHTLPKFLEQEVKDLQAQRFFTVHHSKYSLSPHPWYEPLDNEKQLLRDSVNLIVADMGEVVKL